MSLAARHAGRVSDEGALLLRNVAAWRAAILRQKGRDIWLEIHRVSDPTSLETHGYYRGVVLPLLCEEWGWGNPAELHRELKLLHLPKIIPTSEWPRRRLGADEIVDPPSMADMTQEQSSAFLQAVLEMAAEAGIVVPP